MRLPMESQGNPKSPMENLTKYRLALGAFMLGLILSGITAFPLAWEIRLLGTWHGIAPSLPPEHYTTPSWNTDKPKLPSMLRRNETV